MYSEEDIIKKKLKNYLKILGNNFGPKTKDKKSLFTLKKHYFMGKKRTWLYPLSSTKSNNNKEKKLHSITEWFCIIKHNASLHFGLHYVL